MNQEYYENLKKFCGEEGADLCGVADVGASRDDFALSPASTAGMNRAVCLGVGLSPAVLEEIKDAPTRLYFHHYRTVNVFLDQLALKTSFFIRRKGFSAMPIPASQIIDWQKQTAHLSHKKLAVAAGLGWIGRSNLLVTKDLGSAIRLVTILTDMPLSVDAPVSFACGECRACIDACPARAVSGQPRDFDHLKCFEKLKEFQKQRLVDQYICGVCVKVCKGRNRAYLPPLAGGGRGGGD